MTTIIISIVGKVVSGSYVGAAISACGAWVSNAIDLAILAAYCNPVAALAIVAGVAGTIYSVGHWGLKLW